MNLPTFRKEGRETTLLLSNHFHDRMLERLFSSRGSSHPRDENIAVMITKWLMKCTIVSRPGRDDVLFLLCRKRDFIAVMSREDKPTLMTCYSYRKCNWVKELKDTDDLLLFTDMFGVPNRQDLLCPDSRSQLDKRNHAYEAEYANWATSLKSTP